MDQIANLIQTRASRAALDSKAFEIGEVSGASGSGNLRVDVSGVGTLSEVPRVGIKTPSRPGQFVLLARIAGSIQNSFGLSRAPFQTGETETVSISRPH